MHQLVTVDDVYDQHLFLVSPSLCNIKTRVNLYLYAWIHGVFKDLSTRSSGALSGFGY